MQLHTMNNACASLGTTLTMAAARKTTASPVTAGVLWNLQPFERSAAFLWLYAVAAIVVPIVIGVLLICCGTIWWKQRKSRGTKQLHSASEFSSAAALVPEHNITATASSYYPLSGEQASKPAVKPLQSASPARAAAVTVVSCCRVHACLLACDRGVCTTYLRRTLRC